MMYEGLGAGVRAIISSNGSENSGNLPDFLKAFHKRLVLLGLLDIVICLKANPDRGIGAEGCL